MTRPKNRPPAGKGMARSEQKTNRSRRGSRTVGHLYPELIPAVNRNLYRPQINTTQKSPDGSTRVPPIRGFPMRMRIARITELFSHKTCTERNRPFNRPLFPLPCSVPARFTSSCRRWSSWQPSERRSWRLRPSERRSSGPSSRPRQRWHPRRRRSSSQRSCANGASWASPP